MELELELGLKTHTKYTRSSYGLWRQFGSLGRDLDLTSTLRGYPLHFANMRCSLGDEALSLNTSISHSTSTYFANTLSSLRTDNEA